MAEGSTPYAIALLDLEETIQHLLTRIVQHHHHAKRLISRGNGGETVKKNLKTFLSAIHSCEETVDFDHGRLAADEFYEALNDCRCELESLLTSPESESSENLQIHDADYIVPLLLALFDLDVIAGLLLIEYIDRIITQGAGVSNEDPDDVPVKHDSTQGDTGAADSVPGIKLLLKTEYRPVVIHPRVHALLHQQRRTPTDFLNMSEYYLREVANPLRGVIKRFWDNYAKTLIEQGMQASRSTWLLERQSEILQLVCRLNNITHQYIKSPTYPQLQVRVLITDPAPHYPEQFQMVMIKKLVRCVLLMSSGVDIEYDDYYYFGDDKSKKLLLMKKHEKTIKSICKEAKIHDIGWFYADSPKNHLVFHYGDSEAIAIQSFEEKLKSKLKKEFDEITVESTNKLFNYLGEVIIPNNADSEPPKLGTCELFVQRTGSKTCLYAATCAHVVLLKEQIQELDARIVNEPENFILPSKGSTLKLNDAAIPSKVPPAVQQEHDHLTAMRECREEVNSRQGLILSGTFKNGFTFGQGRFDPNNLRLSMDSPLIDFRPCALIDTFDDPAGAFSNDIALIKSDVKCSDDALEILEDIMPDVEVMSTEDVNQMLADVANPNKTQLHLIYANCNRIGRVIPDVFNREEEEEKKEEKKKEEKDDDNGNNDSTENNNQDSKPTPGTRILFELSKSCKPFRKGDSGSVIYKMEEPDDSGKRKITIIGLMHAGGEGVAHNRYYAIPLDAALRNMEAEYKLETNDLQLEKKLTLLAMSNFI